MELLETQHLPHTVAPGRLKIFFGYAAGVGKTYAMLEAAHQAQKEGIDVVVGYVEPHARPDTLALLDGLETLQPAETNYRGIILREFDLDLALQRNPQLILVDELAHTNATFLIPSLPGDSKYFLDTQRASAKHTPCWKRPIRRKKRGSTLLWDM